MVIKKDQLKKLSAAQFENLVYDLLISLGLQNVIWRTPASDGGKDITGTFLEDEFCGTKKVQRWNIGCKHLKASLSWKTIIEKVYFSKNDKVDYLLIVTSSTLSNQCKDEIERWNKNNFIPQIRYWQECDILSFINRDRYLQCKYFKDGEDYTTMLIIDNIEEIKKLIFCANTNVETGSSLAPLEAISSIFELINDVVYDTQKYGAFKRKEEYFGVDIFNFISAEMCRDISVDKYTIKCVSSLLCAYLMGKKILLSPNDKGVEIKVEMKDDKIKYKLTENQCKLIRRLASLKQYTFEEKENYLFALQGW